VTDWLDELDVEAGRQAVRAAIERMGVSRS
jgi:hypothetical protein